MFLNVERKVRVAFAISIVLIGVSEIILRTVLDSVMQFFISPHLLMNI